MRLNWREKVIGLGAWTLVAIQLFAQDKPAIKMRELDVRTWVSMDSSIYSPALPGPPPQNYARLYVHNDTLKCSFGGSIDSAAQLFFDRVTEAGKRRTAEHDSLCALLDDVGFALVFYWREATLYSPNAAANKAAALAFKKYLERPPCPK